MALPTLQPYWMKNYKSRSEGLMVRRNQNEADRRQAWDGNAKYFHRNEIEATKQRAWGSDTCFQERAEELKSGKETRRKELAQQKLYEHWKQNAPELRQIESEQFKEHVVESWGELNQNNLKSMWLRAGESKLLKKQGTPNLKTAREEDRRINAVMERDRLLAVHKEHEKEEARRRGEKVIAEQLRGQMEELKLREEEAVMLKKEQEMLIAEQQRIEQAEEQRRALEEARRKREFGRVLLRQHKAQMMRKSQEIQQALELDLKILEAMAKEESKDKEIMTSRREKAKADAEYMRQVVADQLKLEREREAELDMLYRDEAARMWSKREAEWERERLARERLMAEVLAERKRQLDDKMSRLRQRQEESIESREELLRELEVVQRMTARERLEEDKKRRDADIQMRAQIEARRERDLEAAMREQEEFDRQKTLVEMRKRFKSCKLEIGKITSLREEDAVYEQMLRDEASRMKSHRPEPRFVPRRRTAFQ
ncbi:predicted protein [Nematostella vectensis]|uniref:Trichoplein keratin filament-binding protein n=1 Tax=Nematostella vectensis TaxID=45351 RepID=A7SKB0_NEMVE|nr:predicted protein [Nematostella vectensis]|eukprot:XP_001627939.1 predicted protein [Nematostella vectensis]